MKFRKKPIVIKGIRVKDIIYFASNNWDELPKWIKNKYEEGKLLIYHDYVIVTTLEGDEKGNIEDYILCGVKGEIYPIKPDILEATYDKVK